MRLKIQHLKNIIQANNDNRLAIFIGAGVSKNSETKSLKIPTWNDIISDLKKELELTDETDFLKIAQLYYLEFNEHSYLKKLRDYFPNNINPSPIHKQIFELNPQVIITTNWDNILEKTIEDNAYIYDVIKCDEDLVKSTLQKKVIKMHGDFNNHNIVFKEDDYLNYHYNFPVIENYVKSIISTHTILFLGYSYNDINFKQIMKWLQNHSKVQPPRYLTVFEENTTQTKYLENHGINIFLLDEPNKEMKVQQDYFENTKNLLDIIQNDENLELYKSNNSIIDFVYNKLKILNELNCILLEQIQNSLTNCGFIYDDDKVILEFYDNILTYDINKEKRNIYKEFVKILAKFDKEETSNNNLIRIFEILRKANIKGIVISSDNKKSAQKEYIVLDEYTKEIYPDTALKYFNFDFSEQNNSTNEIYELLNNSYLLYQLGDYEQSFALIEKIITLSLKQKNYTLLFIAMFNRNVLSRSLKFGFNFNRENFKDIKEYNLEEKFNELPKDIKRALKPIYNFINSAYLYKYAYNISEELRKKEESKKTIESGGMVFNNNATESLSKHKNLVSFVLRNRIMIENHSEYLSINKHFTEIAIIRQIQKEEISLNRNELFSTIKYLENKDLKNLFEKFYKYNSDSKGKFTLCKEDKEWIIEVVLANIVEIYITKKSPFGKFKKYIKNSIFLLSIIKLTEKEANQIIAIFQKITEKAINTIGLYESINLFFGIQFSLYKTNIDEKLLINLIKTIIIKFVIKKYNGHDFHAITRNEVFYLYDYAKQKKAIFNDEKLINQLLSGILELSIEEQLNISKSLLFSIFDIASIKIKKTIKEFILNINSHETKEKHDYLIFELQLIIRKFKEIDTEIIEHLSEYFKQFENSKTFLFIWYTLDDQIDFLITERKYSQLQPISIIIKRHIEIYKNSERLSLF